MTILFQAEAPPLRVDESGSIRIGSTRVLLELVIDEYQRGASPELIVEAYSTLALSDVYAVVAYYLRHRDEVDQYLADCERQATELWQRIERTQGDLGEIRDRLLKQRQSPE